MVVRQNKTPHTSPNIVGVHYRVGKRIGEGSFGVIYEGTNLITNKLVAIKFEMRKSEAPQLRDEYRSYRILAGETGIPDVHYFGQEGLYNVLCIDLLGPSFEDLFDMCGRRFSVKTVAMLAKNMLSRIQAVHEHNLIYRDIKPDNFLIGYPRSPNFNMVCMVDFGMAKQYRDPRTQQHIPYRERKSLSGTARYMSINTHLGREQSRRDDLEALGHVFMYFLRGSLPWQGLKAATNKQKYEKIGERKQQVGVRELCEGFPPEFAVYLSTVRKYAFEETPDYDYLRGLFDTALANLGVSDDGMYDWRLLNNGSGYDSSSATVSAARHAAHPRASGAYKGDQNHISNQALRSYDNVAHRQSTPNMDQSAANTPGKHSRDHLSPIDAKRADVQLAKANGLAHHSADAANINAQSQNIHASHNGRPHEKQGFMFKIKSAFGCCSSSSV
ncbi:Palmitoylated plasma membrane-bound casein kinase [Coemansia sp. RSA 2523]|nr:Palmitoylated plasma membrane-bound casein kinase [Coemansia sp. RSA 1752]KAJ1788236.1 Palmitoylated plasma membrane-bound casein kinase [Coemansia sp. RSA 1938]KAJ1791450.1 Palmitoylated plasma membrane-bound casein kinase [Coemansia sp. RSA 2167]KAJ1810415.1 Palmitoylated plasma membrane-bound casein kinase [Coemansia sp. RSA 2523]KAJ2149362.1 Palmitoylated plasma membrane-bound casein kinase [Coemansia sp. RSA 564]KAJ2257194.1 Palmitoylated plasma membrane-bound casein kinase [Coemansia 